MSFRGSFFFCSQHPLISSSSARAPLSLYCVRLVGAFELLSLRDTLAPVRMTSHGAAIFLSGALFRGERKRITLAMHRHGKMKEGGGYMRMGGGMSVGT